METAELPETVAENTSRFFGGPVESFDDMVAAIRRVVDGDGIAIEELCRVERETPHYAQTDDQTYYFRCFYDGIALAHLVDGPVQIRTETPAGESIEIEASPGSGIDVTPSAAVMSFGVATECAVPVDETPAAEDVYGAVCPYVRAFATREGYRSWAEGAAATTVGFPLESGMRIAAALTASDSSEATE